MLIGAGHHYYAASTVGTKAYVHTMKFCDRNHYVYADLPQGEVVSNGVGGVSGGLIQTMEGGVVTKRSSRIAGMTRKESGGLGDSE